MFVFLWNGCEGKLIKVNLVFWVIKAIPDFYAIDIASFTRRIESLFILGLFLPHLKMHSFLTEQFYKNIEVQNRQKLGTN